MTAAFVVGWLVSLITAAETDEAKFEAMTVRNYLGIGAD
jgi:cation/acetate symporter